MERLYEELGASPTDSREELQRRYRQRALELHPDIHSDPGADEAMRRLNHAWKVLGDPDARRRYDDQSLGRGSPAATAPEGIAPVLVPRPLRLIRPSIVIPFVLFVIFVGTAYAGRVGTGTPTPTPAPGISATTTSGSGSDSLVGHCVRRLTSSLKIVSCSQSNDGEVAALVALSERCPAETVGAAVPGQATVACLKRVAP